jgi:hypothetical protein
MPDQDVARKLWRLEMPMKQLLLVIIVALWNTQLTEPAFSDVKFGKNVRIGGHDVSNQTFNKKRRGKFYIYNTTPPNEGCKWRSNSDGSRTKVCRLKRKAH